MVTEDSLITSALRAELVARIGAHRYELWFGPHTRLCLAEQCLTIRAASNFVRDWLRRHFTVDVLACCQTVLGRELPIQFETDTTLGQTAAPQPANHGDISRPAAEQKDSSQQKLPDQSQVAADNQRDAAETCSTATNSQGGGRRPDASLAGYVVGSCNEYAYRLAQLTAVAGPGCASPVLFYGTTGVGKTHLLRAIRAEYQQRHRRARALYLTAEQFTTGFIEALRGSGLPSFRQKCRDVAMLVVDDVQFFAGKRATLEELLHTLDALLAEGRQVVLASDRSTADLRALGPELVSRISGGLACEIEPPDYATRLSLVRRMGQEMALDLDETIVSRVAGQITAGARELRGALYRLQVMALAAGGQLSCDAADRALADLVQQSTRAVRLADVQQVVCDMFGVEAAQLRSDSKERAVSEPRMLAMWLARKYTRAAWSEIGRYFGRKSHSTVISAHRRVERLIGQQAQVGLSDRTCKLEDAIRRLETALRTA